MILPANRFLSGNTKIFTRLNSTKSHILHAHEFYEILYVKQGEYIHVFKDGKEQQLNIGDGIIVPPHQAHLFYSDNKHNIKRDILIEKEYFKTICSLVQNSFEVINENFQQRKLTFTIDELNTMETFYLMYNQETDMGLRQSLALSAIFIIINKFLKSSYKTSTNTLVSRIIERISRPPYLSNGLDELANEFNYTPQYLCSYFKKHTRCTLTEYVNNIKLSQIEFYLLNTEMSLREIADAVEIDSLSYMNRLFSEKYRSTPKKYRMENSLYYVQQSLNNNN